MKNNVNDDKWEGEVEGEYDERVFIMITDDDEGVKVESMMGIRIGMEMGERWEDPPVATREPETQRTRNLPFRSANPQISEIF